jgi:hypothetical protein
MFSTALQGVGKDGEAFFPMGVEQRLKVARNTSFRQEEKGMLGGTSVATHTVEIELRSQMPDPTTIEVMERLPIAEENEKDIKIEIIEETPAGKGVEFIEEKRLRGTRRWTIEMEPGGMKQLRLKYGITLPSKMEVIGGNRRV